MNDLKIYGPKISFDKDIFKNLNPVNEFLYLKDIRKKTMPYHKLSISQKRMNNLLVDYEYAVGKISDVLSVCRKKKINRYGQQSYNPQIIEYNDEYVEKMKGKTKKNKKTINKKATSRKKRTINKTNKIKILYFYRNKCIWCTKFNKTWKLFKTKFKNITFLKINGTNNPKLTSKYNIESFPTIVKITGKNHEKFDSQKKRTLTNLKEFVKI